MMSLHVIYVCINIIFMYMFFMFQRLKVVRRIPVLSITLNVTKPLDMESIQKPKGTSAPHTRKSPVTSKLHKKHQTDKPS